MKTQREIVEYLYEHKEGSSEELKLLIGENKFKGLCLTGFINDNFNHWVANERVDEYWNCVIRKPTLKEVIMGYYCHYFLGF